MNSSYDGCVVVVDLDAVLASSCRRKILRFLETAGRAHVMGLVRNVNSTYSQVNSQLRILREEGIIFDERFGRMRVVRLNHDSPKTALLLKALRILDTQLRQTTSAERVLR